MTALHLSSKCGLNIATSPLRRWSKDDYITNKDTTN